MRLASLITALLVWAAPLAAQGWTAEITRDDVYDAGRVVMHGNGMVVSCAARSPRRAPVLNSRWWEVSVAPPWQYLIVFNDQLVPLEGQAQEAEMTLFVDQTGYRLPVVYRNELEGGWQTMLGMTDPMFGAIDGASNLVLQVGRVAAWEIPVAGLAQGLKEIRDACAATWNATGSPTPAGISTQGTAAPAPAPTAAFTLPPQVQAHANQQCGGVAAFNEGALQAGDLDADGAPDVVLDWGHVRCNGSDMRGFCGAANCEYNVFLSSRGYAMASAHLAVGGDIVTHRSGRLGLRMGGTARVCSQIDCNEPWLWNGTAMVQVP